MCKEVEVDFSLYYLSEVLNALDNHNFDDDITKLLNDLTILVDKKIFPPELNDYDIYDEKIIIKYLLKK